MLVDIDSNGSLHSSFGVGEGVDSLPYADQKCFFFKGGLPLVDSIGEFDADNGLLGIDNKSTSFIESVFDNKSAASAVLGRRLNIESPFGMLVDRASSVGCPGLAMELILLDNE